MEKRAKTLATEALNIWTKLEVDVHAVKQSELEDRKLRSIGHTLENIKFNEKPGELFAFLRPKIFELGEDVVELFNSRTISYHVYDFFLEIIPRAHYLALVINIDFEECEDPSQIAIDATEYAFITHSTERGGVLFNIEDPSHIEPAMNIIRQAYELVTE